MKKFDVYELIQNREISDFFRKNRKFSIREQIQLVLHSYASVEEKRDNLYKLATTVDGAERKWVETIGFVLDKCMDQIYKPKERALYISEVASNYGNRKYHISDHFRFITGELNFHSNVEQLKQELEDIGYVQDGCNKRVYVYQLLILIDGGYKIGLEFEMTWINGILEVINFYPTEAFLQEIGVIKAAYDEFSDIGVSHLQLPFEDGCRLKIQTPVMEKAVYGILDAEQDGFGCWYYFFQPEGAENDHELIDLSYHEIGVSSGYNVYDWVERAEQN